MLLEQCYTDQGRATTLKSLGSKSPAHFTAPYPAMWPVQYHQTTLLLSHYLQQDHTQLI